MSISVHGSLLPAPIALEHRVEQHAVKGRDQRRREHDHRGRDPPQWVPPGRSPKAAVQIDRRLRLCLWLPLRLRMRMLRLH